LVTLQLFRKSRILLTGHIIIIQEEEDPSYSSHYNYSGGGESFYLSHNYSGGGGSFLLVTSILILTLGYPLLLLESILGNPLALFVH
jgi:hypothetical protein